MLLIKDRLPSDLVKKYTFVKNLNEDPLREFRNNQLRLEFKLSLFDLPRYLKDIGDGLEFDRFEEDYPVVKNGHKSTFYVAWNNAVVEDSYIVVDKKNVIYNPAIVHRFFSVITKIKTPIDTKFSLVKDNKVILIKECKKDTPTDIVLPARIVPHSHIEFLFDPPVDKYYFTGILSAELEQFFVTPETNVYIGESINNKAIIISGGIMSEW